MDKMELISTHILVKLIEVWFFLQKFEKKIFWNLLAWLWKIWNESMQEKATQSTVLCSKYYDLTVTYLLIISLIFIFLCWPEQTNDNKELSHENWKSLRESQITTHWVEPWTFSPILGNKWQKLIKLEVFTLVSQS